MTDQRAVSRSAWVPAPPGEVFDLLADPRQHRSIDGSGSVRGVLLAPDRLSLGARFAMRMSLGLPYATRNTVVEFDEDTRIAWRQQIGHHLWRWELEPAKGGTAVTESFDWSGALAPAALELAGFPARNAQHIESSLDLLREHFSV